MKTKSRSNVIQDQYNPMLPALLLYRLQESIIREFAIVEQRVMIWRDDDAGSVARKTIQQLVETIHVVPTEAVDMLSVFFDVCSRATWIVQVVMSEPFLPNTAQSAKSIMSTIFSARSTITGPG